MTSISPPPIKPWQAYVVTWLPPVGDLPGSVSFRSHSGWKREYSPDEAMEIIPVIAGRLAAGKLTMHLFFVAQPELADLFLHLTTAENIDCVWSSPEGGEVTP